MRTRDYLIAVLTGVVIVAVIVIPVTLRNTKRSAAVENYDSPDYIARLDARKLAWTLDEIGRAEQARQAQAAQEAMAHRINCYLASRGSPMQGLGMKFVLSAARYGIDPRLSVAIAEGESSCGLACFSNHNAWGMLAYPEGFGSWEEGIDANLDWLHRYFGSPQTAYDCPGYCIPDHPWMENVDSVRQSI
jgi:hypothetical protein